MSIPSMLRPPSLLLHSNSSLLSLQFLSEIEEASNAIVSKNLKVEASWLDVESEGEERKPI